MSGDTDAPKKVSCCHSGCSPVVTTHQSATSSLSNIHGSEQMSDAPSNYNRLQWKSAGYKSGGVYICRCPLLRNEVPCPGTCFCVPSHPALAQDSASSCEHLPRQVTEPPTLLVSIISRLQVAFCFPFLLLNPHV